jgi:hypothetical protein
MQESGPAPEAVELSGESGADPKALCGLDDKATGESSGRTLSSRATIGRARRCDYGSVLYSGSGSGWDAHNDIEGNHTKFCKSTDKPIAGLLADLKRAGSSMPHAAPAIWGGEFGPDTFNEKGTETGSQSLKILQFGWPAGSESRVDGVMGSTDEIGLRATERKCHVHDIHATILHLLGLDNLKLTYLHNGRTNAHDQRRRGDHRALA